MKGTKLKDIKVDKTGNATGGLRKELLDGGKAKIDASKDPMIELARALDGDAAPSARSSRPRSTAP